MHAKTYVGDLEPKTPQGFLNSLLGSRVTRWLPFAVGKDHVYVDLCFKGSDKVERALRIVMLTGTSTEALTKELKEKGEKDVPDAASEAFINGLEQAKAIVEVAMKEKLR